VPVCAQSSTTEEAQPSGQAKPETQTRTPSKQTVTVERAVQIIESILKDHEGVDPEKPPRVFFNGFNEWSLNILVIAWYHPPDYWAYQAWLQRTCLEIMKHFENEGIEFAFPSRTIYMAGQNTSHGSMEHRERNPENHLEGEKKK